MSSTEVDILLVEDNRDDAELALHALRREKLANNIFVARMVKKRWSSSSARAPFTRRSFEHPPKLILLDLKLPKVDGMEVLKRQK